MICDNEACIDENGGRYATHAFTYYIPTVYMNHKSMCVNT